MSDADDEVIAMALHIMEEACDVPRYLDAAVLRNPTQILSRCGTACLAKVSCDY